MRCTRSILVIGVMGVALAAPALTTRAAVLVNDTQFGTDPTLIVQPGAFVYDSQAFPDGTHTAQCFIRVARLGDQLTSNYLGNCTPYSINVSCASGAFDNSDTLDDHGAANVIAVSGSIADTTHHDSGAYDNGFTSGNPNCGTVADVNNVTIRATLYFDLSGYASGQKLVLFWNNDHSAERDGCVTYSDNFVASGNWCFANQSSSNNGDYYEVTAQSTSGRGYMGNFIGCSTGCSANLTLGGVFIESASVTNASYSSLHIHHSHGLSVITWTSHQLVLGFNVFDSTHKLNSHLVIGHNHRYRFTTRHTIHKLRIVPVWPNG